MLYGQGNDGVASGSMSGEAATVRDTERSSCIRSMFQCRTTKEQLLHAPSSTSIFSLSSSSPLSSTSQVGKGMTDEATGSLSICLDLKRSVLDVFHGLKAYVPRVDCSTTSTKTTRSRHRRAIEVDPRRTSEKGGCSSVT